MPTPFARRAAPADIEQLASFDEWTRATPEAISDGTCFAAGYDTEILAYGILDRSFFGRPFVAIIFVHPDHRKNGLGTALVEHFVSITDHKQLWVSTNIENLGMQRILQRLNFRLSGVVNDLGKLPELFYVRTREA